jgi:hypothetical protein
MIFMLQAYCNLAMCKAIPEAVTIMTRSNKIGDNQKQVRRVENRNSTTFLKKQLIDPKKK